jgi:predicted ATPase
MGGASCSSVRSVNVPQPVFSERGVSPSVGYLLNIVHAHSAVATFVTEIMVASAFTPLVMWRMVLSVSRWWWCILREFLNSVRAML